MRRLRKNRAMSSVTLRMPEEVLMAVEIRVFLAVEAFR
jgi:hypothetical protein